MPQRTRLSPDARRVQLIDTAAREFAIHPYDDVRMDVIAERAEVSRGLLYRYFPTKRDLFAAVYRHAAHDLLDRTRFDTEHDLYGQIVAGLDVHFDFFETNRHIFLAANRTLGGDPLIHSTIEKGLAGLRDEVIKVAGLSGRSRDLAAAAVLAWLSFVRTLCVEWQTTGGFSRDELRQMCLDALFGALGTTVPALASRAPDA